MDIGIPLRELGEFDSSALRDAILTQDAAAWNEDQYRQDKYEVHRQTESIVLVFTDGSDWPKSTVQKEPGWDRLADVAVPLMHAIIDKHYPKGGTIIRAMAAKLLAGAPVISLWPSYSHSDHDQLARAFHDRRSTLSVQSW
jgi:hypothetical protein